MGHSLFGKDEPMKHFCIVCDKNLLVGNYKARKMHVNGARHRLMLRTHYMEILENKDVRERLESVKKLSSFLERKEIKKEVKQIDMKNIPPAPKDFKLPEGFDFGDIRNFDPNLDIAISRIVDRENV